MLAASPLARLPTCAIPSGCQALFASAKSRAGYIACKVSSAFSRTPSLHIRQGAYPLARSLLCSSAVNLRRRDAPLVNGRKDHFAARSPVASGFYRNPLCVFHCLLASRKTPCPLTLPTAPFLREICSSLPASLYPKTLFCKKVSSTSKNFTHKNLSRKYPARF